MPRILLAFVVVVGCSRAEPPASKPVAAAPRVAAPPIQPAPQPVAPVAPIAEKPAEPEPVAPQKEPPKREPIKLPVQWGTEGIARQMARKFLSKTLKFPLDAEFRDDLEAAVYSEETGCWIVKGAVKAKNAFGAALTQEFFVELFLNEKDVWHARVILLGNDTENAYVNSDAKSPVMLQNEAKERAAKREVAEFYRRRQQESDRIDRERAEEARRLMLAASAEEWESLEKRLAAADKWDDKLKADVTAFAKKYPDAPKFAAADRELKGASKLQLARNFLNRGNAKTGKEWLGNVVSEYPRTLAAKEAEAALKKLGGQP